MILARDQEGFYLEEDWSSIPEKEEAIRTEHNCRQLSVPYGWLSFHDFGYFHSTRHLVYCITFLFIPGVLKVKYDGCFLGW